MAKGRKRSSVADPPTGPKEAHATVLSLDDEAVVVAFRRPAAVEKIKTIGDAYMAASGLPEPRADHAAAAVAFARDLVAEASRADWPNPPLRIRVGVHSGPVIAGLIGKKRFIYDVWGHTVNMASRLEAHSAPGRIHISQNTLTALGGRVAVERQGKIDLKGIGLVPTFLVSE